MLASVYLLALPDAYAIEADDGLSVVLEATDRHHPVIKQRVQEYYIQREGLAATHAAYLPSLSVEGRLLATDRDAVLQTGEDFDEDTTQKSAAVSLQQVLYNGGRRGLERHIAMLRLRIARQDLEVTRREVLRQTVQELYGLAAARETLILRNQLAELLSEQVAAATAREKVGDATQTDITIAESRLQLARAAIAETEFQLVVFLEALMSSSGLDPSFLRMPLEGYVSVVPDEDTLERSIGKDPRVIGATLQTAVADAEHKLAARTNAPVLGLAATASTAQEVSPAIDESDELSVGLTLNIPLYRGGLGASEQRRAAATSRATMFAEREARRQTELDLKRLYAERNAARAALQAAERRSVAAATAEEGFLAGQKAGFYSTVDTLDAIEDRVEADIARVQALAQLASVQARLMIALGKEFK
ncbi:MAG: TolC family protein [Pseudomonadota bacterium]